jgi:hypothetical protein
MNYDTRAARLADVTPRGVSLFSIRARFAREGARAGANDRRHHTINTIESVPFLANSFITGRNPSFRSVMPGINRVPWEKTTMVA